MGIVAKQSLRGSVLTYVAIVIGFINAGLIFPKVLNTEQIGLLNILISYATILGQFGNLGFTNTIIKFFPYFRSNDQYHNGFLKIVTIVSFIGFVLSLVLFFILKSYLVRSGTEKSTLFFEYIYLLIPLIFFTIYFNAYDTYYRALFNSVAGIFYKEFIVRILTLMFIIMYYFQILDFKEFIISYVVANSFPALGIVISIFQAGQFRFGIRKIKIKKGLKKSMANVSLYSIISSFSGVMLINIDRIMLERFNGLSDVGIYSIAFFFASLVAVSARPVSRISGSVIAEFWKLKNLTKISEIYYSTTINQFIVGLLVLLGIWANINNVFRILPHEYIVGKYVILLLALSFLTDMLSGASANILAFSRYYRYHTYFMIFYIIIVVLLNWILIPIFGILGAAMGALISKILFNLIRGIFLYIKFKFSPYNFKFLVVIAIGLISYFISYLLPEIKYLYIDILIRSSIISSIFIFFIFIFKISDDIDNKIVEVFNVIKNKFK